VILTIASLQCVIVLIVSMFYVILMVVILPNSMVPLKCTEENSVINVTNASFIC
jgi:hypothetical protein